MAIDISVVGRNGVQRSHRGRHHVVQPHRAQQHRGAEVRTAAHRRGRGFGSRLLRGEAAYCGRIMPLVRAIHRARHVPLVPGSSGPAPTCGGRLIGWLKFRRLGVLWRHLMLPFAPNATCLERAHCGSESRHSQRRPTTLVRRQGATSRGRRCRYISAPRPNLTASSRRVDNFFASGPCPPPAPRRALGPRITPCGAGTARRRSTASPRAIIASGQSVCEHDRGRACPSETPLDDHDEVAHRVGQRGVCSQSGMFSIGLAKPDSSIAGTMNTNAPRIACCCVLASDETNSPTPITASR